MTRLWSMRQKDQIRQSPVSMQHKRTHDSPAEHEQEEDSEMAVRAVGVQHKSTHDSPAEHETGRRQ